MSYEKQNFVDGQILEAEHLNHMESGIESINSEVETVKSGLESINSEVETVKSGLESINSEVETVQDSVDALFTSVSNGKALVASAITDKGVDTANDATFEVMATNIAEIKTGSDNFPIGDGNTHIWISLAEGRTSPMLSLGVKGTVTVDWGDGSEPDTLTGTSLTTNVYTPAHNYASVGDYVITISGESYALVPSGMKSGILVSSKNTFSDYVGSAYICAIKKLEIVTPDKVLAAYSVSNCYGLQEVSLSCASIENHAVNSCFGMTQISFSCDITSIGESFKSCYGCKVYDFSQHTFVPSLSTTSAFSNIPTDCIFRIPAALYDEWIAATNWSAIAATNTFVGV